MKAKEQLTQINTDVHSELYPFTSLEKKKEKKNYRKKLSSICMGEADRFKRITIPNHLARGKEWQNKRTKPNQAAPGENSGRTGWNRMEIEPNQIKPSCTW